MSTIGNARPPRTARRHTPARKSRPKHVRVASPRSGQAAEEILQLVRTGVERFLLKNATVGEFSGTIRAVAEKEASYSRLLTRSVFSRIVKDAIRKRNLRRAR